MIMSKPLRVFVDHGEAYGNLGDEAMLSNALRRLQAQLGECIFVIPREGTRPLPVFDGWRVEEVPSPFLFYMAVRDCLQALLTRMRGHGLPLAELTLPQISAAAHLLFGLKKHGVARKICGDLTSLIAALRSCDAFYGVGAADFNDFNAFGAAYKTWLYEAVRPFVAVSAVGPQGFGPLTRTDLKSLMARAFDRLDLLAFRDHAFSADYTRTLALSHCRTKITADEALSLPLASDADRDSYLKSAGLAPAENFIAVHWRSTDYTQDTDRYYDKVAAAFDTATELTGLRLVFFPMSYDVHSRHDKDCGAELAARMKHSSRLLMAPVTKDVQLIKTSIAAARFTLGLSYHVHVFALSEGKPAIIIFTGDYYRFKSHGLVDFYGAPSTAIDLATADESELRTAIQVIHSQHDKAGHKIKTVNAELAKRNDWVISEMAALLRLKGRLT